MGGSRSQFLVISETSVKKEPRKGEKGQNTGGRPQHDGKLYTKTQQVLNSRKKQNKAQFMGKGRGVGKELALRSPKNAIKPSEVSLVKIFNGGNGLSGKTSQKKEKIDPGCSKRMKKIDVQLKTPLIHPDVHDTDLESICKKRVTPKGRRKACQGRGPSETKWFDDYRHFGGRP